MSRETIKYIAMAAMLLNHIAIVFLEPGTVLCEALTDVGYFTAAAMCCFLVEGYQYTHSKKNYALRLAVFAVLSEIPYCLAFTENGYLSFCGMNMMFTLLLCFGIVHVMNTMPKGSGRTGLLSALALLSLISDWALAAPVFTIWFVQAGKDRKVIRNAFGKAMLLFGIWNLPQNLQMYPVREALVRTLCCTFGIGAAGICITFFYNGKQMERGQKFSKWFFYLFYPVHLLILGVLRIAVMEGIL